MTRRYSRGFTLAELLLAAAILAFALSALLLFFINCIFLNQTSRNLTLAFSAVQVRMEEIKDVGFSGLPALNPNFDLSGFPTGTARGRITVVDQSARLRRVRIVACFMSGNRLIGDNINNCQNSPVELVTLIAE